MDAALHIGGGDLPYRALLRRQCIDRIEIGRCPIVAFGPELDGACDVGEHRGRETGAGSQYGRAVVGCPRGLQPLQECFSGPRRNRKIRGERFPGSGLRFVPLDDDDLRFGLRLVAAVGLLDGSKAALGRRDQTRGVEREAEGHRLGHGGVAIVQQLPGKIRAAGKCAADRCNGDKGGDHDPMARHRGASEVQCSAPSR